MTSAGSMHDRPLRAARLMLSALSLAVTAPAQAAAGDIRIADADVYPESLSEDAAGRLYIGSIKGIVFRTGASGDVAEAWIRPTPQNGILTILGVLVDEPRRTLWLCSSPSPFRNPPAVGVSAVKAFDLKTGKLNGSYPFPAPASACNDVAVAADGTLYATDTPNGRILTLRPGATGLTLFAEDARLKGIDGIAFAEDGAMYVNTVSTNRMFRVGRAQDGAFAGLTELTLSQPVSGPDALRPLGGNRFVQAEGNSGRITEVTIAGDTATIRVLREGMQSAAAAAPARGRIYAVEGKIGHLVDPKLKGQSPGPFVATAIPLEPAR